MDSLNAEEIFNPNDTFNMSMNSNLVDSNLFGMIGDKSLIFKQKIENDNENEKPNDDENKSYFTLDLELEKQVALLTGDDVEEDDLNDAKLNLENDNSNWSSASILMINNNNKTTQALDNNFLNNQVFPAIESEDKISTTTNLTTNLTSNNTSKNINPSSSIINGLNYDNNNDLVRKFSISSLHDKQTEYNNKAYNPNNFSSYLNNITNGSNIPGSGGIWNSRLGLDFNGGFNNLKDNMTYFNPNQSYDFQSKSLDMNSIIYKNKIFNNQTYNDLVGKNFYNNRFYKHQPKLNKLHKNIIHSNFFSNYPNNFSYYSNISQISMNSFNNNLSNNKSLKNTINSKDRNKSYNAKIILMIKDQNGSKYIQKKIEEKSPEFLFKLYQSMKNHLYEIFNDQSGNYVIQKYVEYCDKKILSAMLKQLFNKGEKIIYEISMNPYGTRGFQKLLDNLSPSMKEEDINIIFRAIKGNVFSMIKDINGNRVISSIIENIKNKELLSPLYKEMNENMISISMTKSGSCVFSKLLNNITENDLKIIINNILDNIEILINNEFGNFIIQKILSLNKNEYNQRIFDYIKDKIQKLSKQKFASNVIESCITSNPKFKTDIIKLLIEGNHIKELIIDKYGNYIIQKILNYVGENEFNIIMEQIKDSTKLLKQTDYGRKIYQKLVKNYRQYLDSDNSKCIQKNHSINIKK